MKSLPMSFGILFLLSQVHSYAFAFGDPANRVPREPMLGGTNLVECTSTNNPVIHGIAAYSLDRVRGNLILTKISNPGPRYNLLAKAEVTPGHPLGFRCDSSTNTFSLVRQHASGLFIQMSQGQDGKLKYQTAAKDEVNDNPLAWPPEYVLKCRVSSACDSK
jgi:hypothetical protein